MLDLFSCFFKKMQNLNKNFALLVCFIVLASIYPSKRFLFEYGINLKLGLGIIALSALFYFLKSKLTRQYTFLLLCLSCMLLSFVFSVFTSTYPVRAGSELDIMLGSIAFAFLFCFWGKDNLQKSLQILGVVVMLFLHFSACLTLSCLCEFTPFSYPFTGLFLHNFFNLTTPFQLLMKATDVRCPLEYTHYTGLFTVIAFPFFVGLLLSEKRKFMKILWGIGAVYALLIGYVSHGRSCILLLMFECFLFLMLFFIKNKKISTKCKWSILIFCFLIAGTTLVVTPKLRLGIVQTKGIKEFLGDRYYLAQSGFALVKDKPLWGHGITTTPLHYLESKPTVLHHCWQLHVAPIQFLVEFGWIGGVFYFCLLLYILYCGISVLRNTAIPTHYRQLTLGCFISFLGYLLFVTEASWDVFAISCFICVIGGVLISVYQQFREKNPKVCPCGFVYKFTILGAFIVCLFFSIKDMMGRKYFEEALHYCHLDKKAQAFHYIDKALRQDPHSLHYLNQAGYFSAQKGYGWNDALVRKAIAFYERSIAINPNQLEILESLGALYVYLGDIGKGVNYFCDTINCVPHKIATYVQLLYVLKRSHQQELYDKWLGFFTFVQPGLVFSQPVLIEELSKNVNAQNICLQYFADIEKRYPNEDRNGDWDFEKYCREALFKRNFHKLSLPDYAFLRNGNWVKGLSWDNMLKEAKKQRSQSKFYYLHLDQHSNMNILLHGGRGVRVRIATLVPIFDLKSKKWEVADSSPSYKHVREVVKPLVQATKEWSNRIR